MSKGLSSRYTGCSGFKVPGGVKIAIILDDSMFEKVGTLAMQRDISIAAAIRSLISIALESSTSTPAPKPVRETEPC